MNLGRYSGLALITKPFSFQVREPAEVISDDVVIFTPRTSYDHHTFVVGVFGYLLLGPGGANLKQTCIDMQFRYTGRKKNVTSTFSWVETTTTMSIYELCKQRHLARVN